VLSMLSVMNFPENAYDVAVEAAKSGDKDAQLVVKSLDQAMKDTYVVQSESAFRVIGDMVLKMAFLVDSPCTVDDVAAANDLAYVIDTYDRFTALMDDTGKMA